MPKIFALVPAAGQGTRLGEAMPKQYLALAGRPMLFHSLATLASVPRVERVLAILAPGDRYWEAQDRAALPAKVEALFAGGATRGESVANALAAMQGRASPDDWVLVHDAARPCIAREWVERLIDAVGDDAAGGLLAMPVADTLKRAAGADRVAQTVEREGLWRAQTPQMFRYGLLRQGLARLPGATDESQAVEAVGGRPRLVAGDNANFKVTFAEDLPLAEMILQRRGARR